MTNNTYNKYCPGNYCVVTNCNDGACTVQMCDANGNNCKDYVNPTDCDNNVCVTTTCDDNQNCTVSICTGPGNCSTQSVNTSGSSDDGSSTGSKSTDSFNTGSYVLFVAVLLWVLVTLIWVVPGSTSTVKWVAGALGLVVVILSSITTFAWQYQKNQERTRKLISSPVFVLALTVIAYVIFKWEQGKKISPIPIAAGLLSLLLCVIGLVLYGFY